MIHYRDMTFCMDADKCANHESCRRWFSPHQSEMAKKWWGSDDYPVAFSPFKETCGEFEEKK